jgi:ribonuclease HI
MTEVDIYTDGACSGNPGPGGYGVVLIYGKHRKELSGGYKKTTNNRMELIAAILGLETLKRPCEVKLYSDSSYLVDAVEKGWALRWKATGWKGKKNRDLWEKVLTLLNTHKVQCIWVKGHASNKENNRCDELAVAASKGKNLPADEGYERFLFWKQAQETLF